MVIRTKYSKGDKVYLLENGKLRSFTIRSIRVTVSEYTFKDTGSQKEEYSDNLYGRENFYPVSLLFKNPKALYTQLLKELKHNEK